MNQHNFDVVISICSQCGITLQEAMLDRGNVCPMSPPTAIRALRVLDLERNRPADEPAIIDEKRKFAPQENKP
jgi:hypothetical protein